MIPKECKRLAEVDFVLSVVKDACIRENNRKTRVNSGPGTRPMNKSWVIDIQQKCNEAKVPFFFKQWGGVNKKKAGRLLDGTTYFEMPSRDCGIYRPTFVLNLQ
jgi:protein gp37